MFSFEKPPSMLTLAMNTRCVTSQSGMLRLFIVSSICSTVAWM